MATAFASSDMAVRTRPAATLKQFAGRPRALFASRLQLRSQGRRQVTRMAVRAQSQRVRAFFGVGGMNVMLLSCRCALAKGFILTAGSTSAMTSLDLYHLKPTSIDFPHKVSACHFALSRAEE